MAIVFSRYLALHVCPRPLHGSHGFPHLASFFQQFYDQTSEHTNSEVPLPSSFQTLYFMYQDTPCPQFLLNLVGSTTLETPRKINFLCLPQE